MFFSSSFKVSELHSLKLSFGQGDKYLVLVFFMWMFSFPNHLLKRLTYFFPMYVFHTLIKSQMTITMCLVTMEICGVPQKMKNIASRAGVVTQVVECLTNKFEVLSSDTNTDKKNNKIKI
jgi:hypothetical protein